MVLEYFTSKKAKKQEEAKTPVLSDEEERFLAKLTDETPPPLPDRPVVILDNGEKVEGKDAQKALMDGADTVPLPLSPPVDDAPADKKGKGKADGDKKKRDYWGFVPTIPSRLKTIRRKSSSHTKSSEATGAKSGTTPGQQEAEQEKDDLTNVLDQLNLAAVNNRVFSFSKESQELLEKFKVVLKDLINGVPTAYDDLEKLLTGSEKQLSALFAAMPPFLQTLVKSLPAKVTASLGPELMAASAEKPGLHVQGESSKKKKRSRVPSLKTLIGEQGAVVTMLRSILNFLKLRFPAVLTGTNVLLSLAVFLLMFVFWYCHKRGKETRLEREKLAAESADVSESEAESVMEDSAINEAVEKAKTPRQIPQTSANANPALEDFPSVLDLPSPAATPLPETPAQKPAEKVEAYKA